MLVAFTEAARAQGWRVFPETAGFDVLLVATDQVTAAGIKPGDQLGVEGKKAGNLKLLTQVRPQRNALKGPHFHVAVVPRATEEFREIAMALNVMVVEACTRGWRNGVRVWERSEFKYDLRFFPPLFRQYYEEPCWHPDVEVWVPPGVNSPKRMSPWKIKAVKLCVLGKRKGFLTSADFRAAGVSMSVWRGRWLKESDTRRGRHKAYTLWEVDYPYDPPPHLKYPEIVAAVSADDAEYEGAIEPLEVPRSRRRRRRRRVA